MIFKSYILENNLESITKCKLFLFYGENNGLKKEFKAKLKTLHKNKEVLNFFQDEIIKNKDLLFNEINNKSLFNEKKIIFINEASDKILENLEKLTSIIQDENIFIFSGILDKKSKLRTFFEKSKECGVVPCYQDNEISIKKIIHNNLINYQGLTSEVINIILQSSGLDRSRVNNEIEKIKSCFKEKKIESKKIQELLNIRFNDNFNTLKDEALRGNSKMTNRLLADTIFEIENCTFYLHLINQRLKKLKKIEQLKEKNTNLESLISELRPPIFWKDKPMIIEQSKKWDKAKLQFAQKKTFNTEIELKSNTSIKKDLLIKNLIVELCATVNSA